MPYHKGRSAKQGRERFERFANGWTDEQEYGETHHAKNEMAYALVDPITVYEGKTRKDRNCRNHP
tara:strand:- start:36 stop:230 length:195 start_codon:yes stop_codon:yes gene_type:complete